MNTITRVCNALCMSVIFLSVLCLQCMESDAQLALQSDFAKATTNKAGENNDTDLLRLAIKNNDVCAVEMLLKQHADPNAIIDYYPLLFSVRTKEVADILIAYGADIHVRTHHCPPNVLWQVLQGRYLSDLLAYYLAHGADAIKLDLHRCLLHGLVWENIYGKIDNVADFLNKGEILLHAIPDMVNLLDASDKTPVDMARMGYEAAAGLISPMISGTPVAFQKLIYLYRSHGGKTLQELLKENMIILLHHDGCVGDLAILPHDVRKYIVEYMVLHFKKQEAEGMPTEEVPNDPYDCSICKNAREKNKS